MLKEFIDLKHTEQFSRLRTAFPNGQQRFPNRATFQPEVARHVVGFCHIIIHNMLWNEVHND